MCACVYHISSRKKAYILENADSQAVKSVLQLILGPPWSSLFTAAPFVFFVNPMGHQDQLEYHICYNNRFLLLNLLAEKQLKYLKYLNLKSQTIFDSVVFYWFRHCGTSKYHTYNLSHLIMCPSLCFPSFLYSAIKCRTVFGASWHRRDIGFFLMWKTPVSRDLVLWGLTCVAMIGASALSASLVFSSHW